MATIQGADIKIELYLSGAWTEITCETTTAEWTWGAPEAMGPLTECEGGTLRVSLWDPTRRYDPDNPDSPLLGQLKVGLPLRVLVDTAPAWTGVLQTWGWDRGSKIADLNGVDPIGQLSLRKLPATMDLPPEGDKMRSTAGQVRYILDYVEWPSAKRVFPNGDQGWYRGNWPVSGSALDGLHMIRFAELGRLYPYRDGRIGWVDRAGVTPPASSAVINCTGVDLTDMWKAMGLGRLRNHVVITDRYGTYGPFLNPDDYRSVVGDRYELALGYFVMPPGGGTYPSQPFPPETTLPWDSWAYHILDRLNPPPVLTVLGTLIPQGPEIKQIACAEFGDRWTVKVTGEPDKVVILLGQTVTVAPDWLEVSVVTEDEVTPPLFIHTGPGIDSHYLHQGENGLEVPPKSPTTFGGTVGQGVIATLPYHEEYETFVYFNTSAIPSNATVTRAEFGSQATRNGIDSSITDPGPQPDFSDFDLQLRSYNTGGWRPTVATGDWVAPPMSSNPIRAKLNTSRIFRGEIFTPFEDVSLAAAIKKGAGAETQFVITSSRHAAGTAPVAGKFETVNIVNPRLRVYYTLPGGGATITKYRDAIMATSGLVGYWRLGESSTASAAADERGVHPGSYAGSPLPTLGAAGAVSDSNTAGTWALGGWVNVPDASTLDLGDAWTIEAWINPATLTSGDWRGIVGKGPGGYYLRLNQAGNLELVKSDTSIIATSTVTIPAGAWAYVVATKSGSTCKLYVNAVDRTGTVTNATTVNTTAPLTIGADTATGGAHREGYAGGLDEVALYSRALSASEVSAHYAARV